MDITTSLTLDIHFIWLLTCTKLKFMPNRKALYSAILTLVQLRIQVEQCSCKIYSLSLSSHISVCPLLITLDYCSNLNDFKYYTCYRKPGSSLVPCGLKYYYLNLYEYYGKRSWFHSRFGRNFLLVVRINHYGEFGNH